MLHVAVLALAIGCDRSPPAPPAPPETKIADNGSPSKANPPAPIAPEIIAENNHGVALMGQFDNAAALEAFTRVLKQRPDLVEVKINQAIALLNMNRQQSDDLTASAKLLKEALAADPSNLRAEYCLGILAYNDSRSDEALGYFRAVAEAGPTDAYAAYYTGRCLFDAEKYDEALAWYQKSMAADPYLISSYYGAFQALQRLEKDTEAAEALKRFQRMSTNPRARKTEIKYTRMGPKAEALAIDARPPEPALALPKPLFRDAKPLLIDSGGRDITWASADAKYPPLSITVCDIDGDGRPDLFITGAIVDGDKRLNAVLLARGDHFLLDPQHPLARVTDINAVLWGDYDNDGLTDVYFCRRGANQLWRQTSKGNWQDVTEDTDAAGPEGNTVSGAFFDADHDGDLDLLLLRATGPNELLINLGSGKFRPMAKEQGLAGSGSPARRCVVGPITCNRVADLLVIHNRPPHEVWRNDRLWNYEPGKGWHKLGAAKLDAAVAADLDVSGQLDLITVGPDGLQRWQLDEHHDWTATTLAPTAKRSTTQAALAIADVGGGGMSAIFTDGAGWRCLGLSTHEKVDFHAEQASLICWTLFNSGGSAGPSVVGFVAEKGPIIWRYGDDRPFVNLTFSGKRAEAAQMRTNASGIGVLGAARIGSRWIPINTYGNDSTGSQSLQPIAIDLGGAKAIDFIELNWPDNVFETELAIEPGATHKIEEKDRIPTSCPLLFAWDGHKFCFVADLLGVGGLGYNTGRGEYAPVRPWENFLLPDGLLQPQDGRLALKLAEPMEEMTYLDSAAMVAYDLPPGWQMTLDERLGVNDPRPTGAPLFYRDTMAPDRATNDRGDDVTAAVAVADGRPAAPGAPDKRFIGRCAEHWIELRFPRAIDDHAGDPVLLTTGWIEFPYSQTMFAAWQAGAEYKAPTIEAQDAGGQWRVIAREIGYPDGMARESTYPLRDLPRGSKALRIRTNMEIYWDRLAVAWSEPCPDAQRRELSLQTAELRDVGFPERTIGPQRQTTFDYDRRRPIEDVRHLAGWHTRLGDIRELVSATDDATVTIGPGEEAELDFAHLPNDLPSGWRRRYVLEIHGWCKDTDLFTKDGDTVEPWPHREGSAAETLRRRDDLHMKYNTRYEAGR